MKSHFILAKLLVILFLGFEMNAQGVVEQFGRVIDSESKMPVSYATIQIADSNKGIVANIDGGFRIPYEFKQQGKIIIISSIGFKTKRVKLSAFENRKVNIIELLPNVEQLDAVVLNASTNSKQKNNISAYTIVKTAIAKIPENYPQNKYSKLGYYRDYQVVNDNYCNLNEAIIESFDTGFDTDLIMNPKNQNVLYSYRVNQDFVRDSMLLLPYDGDNKYINNTHLSGQGGNELGILNIHNPIRNFEQLSFSFVYVFKKKFLDNHKLLDLKKVYLNDEIIYEIPFKADQQLTKASHRAIGKIYISKTDYAIHKLEYAVYEVKNLEPLFEVNIEYKKMNGLMYLNYITFNNQFVVSESSRFEAEKVEYDTSKSSFHVTFNSEVNPSSIERRDFKFRYNGKRLQVETVNVVNSKNVEVKIADWSAPQITNEGLDMSLFKYKFKNISDIYNRVLYGKHKIIGFQFREFFVQEIFENKGMTPNLKPIYKFKPLSEAKLNESEMTKSYWLNSPLKNAGNIKTDN